MSKIVPTKPNKGSSHAPIPRPEQDKHKPNSEVISVELNKRIVRPLAISILVTFIFACSSEQTDQDRSVTISEDRQTSERKGDQTNTQDVIDAAADVVEYMDNRIRERKRKDSLKRVNMRHIYAYQLGMPMRSENIASKVLSRLAHLSDISILRRARKEYLLVQSVGESREDLENGLESATAQCKGNITGAVQIVDLTELCQFKKIVQSKQLKDKLYVTCLQCE